MANITVKVAELAKPLKPMTCAEGTTLASFLEKKDMKYSASIRVNGVVVSKTAVLHAGDIITVIGAVSGGSF
jgi:sulfur carrier protein ThiS